MKTLHVNLPNGRYPILIGSNVLKSLPAWLKKQRTPPSSFHLVSDSKVYSRHGQRVLSTLKQSKVPVHKTLVPSGEKSKSTRQLELIWRDAIRGGVDRSAWIVALGGGVVGDLAGFAAASTLRGIQLLQIPTSLLAMVDSGVGGKTGINLPEGKNLVGAFHQPRAVLIDVNFLKTLPKREIRAGWAEIIKTAAIRDARFFKFLEQNVKNLRAGEKKGLLKAIGACCRIKADVVGKDEKEAGLRMILNYGHTLAHGLEAAVGYHGLLHGEAVSIGMHFAARFGLALGYTSPDVASRIPALLKQFGLPLKLSSRYPVRTRKVLDAMLRDKKVGLAGQLRWVFVPRIGSARIHEDVGWESSREAVSNFIKEGK